MVHLPSCGDGRSGTVVASCVEPDYETVAGSLRLMKIIKGDLKNFTDTRLKICYSKFQAVQKSCRKSPEGLTFKILQQTKVTIPLSSMARTPSKLNPGGKSWGFLPGIKKLMKRLRISTSEVKSGRKAYLYLL